MGVRIKASCKGQVVLPKNTRDRLGIASGTQLDVIDTPGGVELRPVRTDGITVDEAVARLRQIVRYEGPRCDAPEWKQGIDQAVRAKFGDRSA